MKIRETLSLAAACAMTLFVMAGCSGSDSSSGADKSSDAASSGQADSAESSADAPENTAAADTGWSWSGVEIQGGGFVPNIIYNPTEEGLAYCRTDIGGAYRLNKDTGRWECISDMFGGDDWNLIGIESIATDPVEPNRVYVAAGTYSGSKGALLASDDYGKTYTRVDMPFGCGGNEMGRGVGERLAVDPNDNSIIYFGSRSDGLYRSEDYGKSWNKVDSFPTTGGYMEEGNSIGLTFTAFDKNSSSAGEATKTIFVGAARNEGNMLIRSDDAGKTWTEVENPSSEMTGNNTKLRPVQGEVSSDGFLYTTWECGVGPNGAEAGAVQKYDIAKNEWKEITPTVKYKCGYSGISVNPKDPKNIVVTTLDLWYPLDNVFVSNDGGESWKAFWDLDTQDANYEMVIDECPWLGWHGEAKLGWWMTGVAINPFNPDEIMYGTGATIYATDNLTKLGSERVRVLPKAMGIEETAIFDFVAPKKLDDETPELYSIMGDIYGFRHDDVDKAPEQHFGDITACDIDCAANDYHYVVRATEKDRRTVLYSEDGGKTWAAIKTLPEGVASSSGGQVKLSADGKILMWQSGTPGSGAFVTTDWGKTWTACDGLPQASVIESDKVNPNKFYGVHDGSFFMSEDGGKTFSKIADFLVPNVSYEAALNEEGRIYISVNAGSVYTMDAAEGKIERVAGDIQSCRAVGTGAPEKEGDPDTLFIIGEANNEGNGIYISQDRGATWKRINNDDQKWGNVNPKIAGDPKVFGRCYISTNGRGIIRGDKKQ